MFKKIIAGMGIAATAGALALAPLAAQAGDEGSYKLFTSSINDDKTWAVVDTATETTVVAEKKGSEVSIVSGADADARLAAVYDAMPHTEVVELNDGSDMRIITGNGKHKIKVVELDDGDGIDVDVEQLLEKAGVDIEGNITVDTDEGQKVIVVKTLKSDDGETKDVKVEVIRSGEDGDMVDMPEPPLPPEATWTEEGGKKVVVKTNHKMVFDFDSDDGVNRSFMKMTGVSKEDAVEFIDDIEDLTASEKDKMKAALAL
ncbi:hypothetical protein FF098_011975 [Parvularcula flava]|uniref:Uncharacterized protein n=1 Tax=Aquisalinus luteolus TaxID=1566827 RepID=A0A8J3ERJ3_9PROT|nr:hypothetical protein [Aquisalinus luteolus]NHK28627.1 hypothetical protein [Aquisalinus luteolus]GGH99044.1 hypothetical protein GCM10011355_24070 [Aquisalinus luteolus]